MSVYVDKAELPYGRMIMCHMVADTTAELLQMADRIGVAHRWIQKTGTPGEHFDICRAKRKMAVQFGAIEITSPQIVALMWTKRREETVKLR